MHFAVTQLEVLLSQLYTIPSRLAYQRRCWLLLVDADRPPWSLDRMWASVSKVSFALRSAQTGRLRICSRLSHKSSSEVVIQMLREFPKSTHPLVVSYVGVRRAIGVSGLMLPLVLGPIGMLCGIEIQDNMSSYYHTPLRDIFVGTLCSMGIFLFCYQGHDWIENCTANLGCVAALGVALFPLDANSDPLHQRSVIGYLHSVSGGAFFLTLAFYSLFHFPSSKDANLEQEPHAEQRDLVYRTSGVVILLSMVAMGAQLFLLPAEWKVVCNRFNTLFWLEWIAVWAFAAAWLIKGRTILTDVAIDVLAFTQTKLLRSNDKPQ